MKITDIKTEAKAIFEERYFISAGDSNARKEVSLPIITARLIDIATKHANSLGIGNPMMNEVKGGWVLARLTLEFNFYPKVNSFFSIKTWIKSFNRHFSERCFSFIDEDGRVAGYARTIWMVMNTETHLNIGLSHLNLPDNLISGHDIPVENINRHSFQNKIMDFLSSDINPEDNNISTIKHRFGYSDLDAYGHVNTIRYIALLIDAFPLNYHLKYPVKRLELSFSNEACYNMPTLLIKDKEFGDEISNFCLIEENTKNILMTSRVIFQV